MKSWKAEKLAKGLTRLTVQTQTTTEAHVGLWIYGETTGKAS
jgi:predicted Zn-dependent peptidase